MTRWTRRLINMFRRERLERELEAELQSHLGLETDRNVRAGMAPAEARRLAHTRLGGVEQVKERAREALPLRGLVASWLDVKLGGRMLVKYPGLTIVGGLAMAFAICAGTLIFEFGTLFVHPTLPLPAGERIVQIRNWDVAANRPEPRALHDFVVWRRALRSVTELGAWRDVTRTLIVADGEARPVAVAEITASGFRVAGAAPLLGRVLAAADERPNAPPVAVLGYDVWRLRFGSDADVIGRTVQLGNEHATVVGVMHEGFGFPRSHELWMPLRTDIVDQAPRSGPAIRVFGVLAPGVTLETAQVELTVLGRRAAIDVPATHEHLQPRVAPYATAFSDPSAAEVALMFSIYVFAVMLLVVVCLNVALLLFARAATRENEFVVRSALGASRSRVVAQMFAEALVLGGVAAVVGLVAAYFALRSWGVDFLEANMGQLPFWYDLRLSPATVLFAIGLTVLGSAIAGVVACAQGDARPGIPPEAGHGRSGRTAVWRRVDRGHRRAGRGHGGVSRDRLRAAVEGAPHSDVRGRIRRRGVSGGADREGCSDRPGSGRRFGPPCPGGVVCVNRRRAAPARGR